RLILCTELIQLELEWRCRRGESPSLSDYQERFPECAGLFSVWLGEAREAAAAVAAVRKAPAAGVSGTDTIDEALGGPSPPILAEDAPAAGDVPAPLVDHPRYRVRKVLGRGGMGAVYLAEHTVMKRPVALKVIRPELAAQPEAVERFLREVEVA